MTGPEHYREAERLLELVGSEKSVWIMSNTGAGILTSAQVHATLALAAEVAKVAKATDATATIGATLNRAAQSSSRRARDS